MVDGAGPRPVTVQEQVPITEKQVGSPFQLPPVAVYPLHVLGFPEPLERWQPHDPVVNVRVVGGYFPLQRERFARPDAELDTPVVRETLLGLQVRVTPGQKILVVQCREMIIPRDRSFQYQTVFRHEHHVDIPRGNQGRSRPVKFLPQVHRQAHTFRRAVAHACQGGSLDTAFLVSRLVRPFETAYRVKQPGHLGGY